MSQGSIMKEILKEHPEFQNKLFIRGYLITEDIDYDIKKFPFFGNWKVNIIGKYHVYIHKNQHFYKFINESCTLFIIGSCLNPFDGIYEENQILKKLYDKMMISKSEGIDYLNELTGDFLIGMVKNNKLYFLSDPTGMLFGCYGILNGKLYVSSHAQLIADLCKTSKSAYIKKFEKYRYFYKYGLFFPGDLTQYEGITRIVQNHIIVYDGEKIEMERFYPLKKLEITETEQEYEILVDRVYKVLSNTLKLATKKWDNIAISMTGGMDSKTTLACANGMYDKFKFYSYVSMDGDKIDADAAKIIAKKIGVPHQVYNISEKDSDFENIEIEKKILEHNNGEYRVNNNDARKRSYFSTSKLFDVEVKSWVSEIARANYYKKFGLRKMPKHLSARNMTSMFKVFTVQRKLAKCTDKIFEEFIKKTKFHEMPEGFDESDMYLWEFRYSAWGGMVITSEHSYSNEIFIPYNNRRLLNMMLTAPQEKRINDDFHEDIIKRANIKIHDTGITITNWNETKQRMYLEKLYFLISSGLRKL